MKGEVKYGEWAFLGGMALAVVLGLGSSVSLLPVTAMPVILAVLAVLGLVVGLLNISEKETNSFLIAIIALLAVASSITPIEMLLLGVPGGDLVVRAIGGFMSALVAFVLPSAFVVSLKAIYNLAKPE